MIKKSLDNIKCENCKRLLKSTKTNNIKGCGPENADIMIVNDVPGKEEDENGVSFIGKFLKRYILEPVGLIEEEIRYTNVCRCKPPDKKTPSINEVRNCRSFLVEEIKKVKPKIIILLGNIPLNVGLTLYKKKKEDEQKKSGGMSGIIKWRGNLIWHTEFNCWVMSTYSSSYLSKVAYIDGDPESSYLVKQTREDFKIAIAAVNKKKPQDTSPKYRLINTVTSALNLINKILNEKEVVAIDSEATGLDALKDELLGISLAVTRDIGFYLDWRKLGKIKEIRQVINKLLTSKNITRILHNGNYDKKLFISNGLSEMGSYVDTMQAAHLIDENFSKGLKDQAWKYLSIGGYDLELDDYIRKNKIKNWGEIPVELMSKYASFDAIATFRLWVSMRKYVGRYDLLQENSFEEILKKEKLWNLFSKVTMPVRDVLTDIEITGIKWDVKEAQRKERVLAKTIERIEHRIYDIAGREFNINSTVQLSSVLFQDLGLTPYKFTPKGQPSTDKNVLKEISQGKNKRGREIATNLVDLTYLESQSNTFLTKMFNYVDEEDIVRGHYNSVGTKTGRLSCSDPALHGIPKDSYIRSLFVARPGNKFVYADIKGAELRVLAYYSKEQFLIKAFEEGRDVHTETASLVFNVKYDDVIVRQREVSKTINFGIIYGMRPKALAKRIGCIVEEAYEFIDLYFKKLPNVKKWLDDNIKFAKKNGYVITSFGRKRRIPEINSNIFGTRTSAERQANNFVIQSTAVDYVYVCLIAIAREIKRNKLKATFVHTIHDAIIVDTPEKEINKIKYIIQNQFDKTYKFLTTKMEVDLKVEDKWSEGKESHIEELIKKFKIRGKVA